MLSTKNLPIVTKKKMMMMLVLVVMRIARRRHILALLHCDSCSVVTRVVPVLGAGAGAESGRQEIFSPSGTEVMVWYPSVATGP